MAGVGTEKLFENDKVIIPKGNVGAGTTAQDAPEHLRSVVIDSVYTPQVDLYSQIPVNGERAETT